jgi:hypothetical protein
MSSDEKIKQLNKCFKNLPPLRDSNYRAISYKAVALTYNLITLMKKS